MAGVWSESGLPYHGKSRGRVETGQGARGEANYGKPADAIVPKDHQFGEGPDFKGWVVSESYQVKGRKQETFEEKTSPQKDRTASEGYVGGQAFLWITENNPTEDNRLGYGLLEAILSPSNLDAAYKRVKCNKGAGGGDKMGLDP